MFLTYSAWYFKSKPSSTVPSCFSISEVLGAPCCCPPISTTSEPRVQDTWSRRHSRRRCWVRAHLPVAVLKLRQL